MAKKYKGYEEIQDIDIQTEDKDAEVHTTYRTLFIGLGGTGGEVLNKLSGMLTDEEKKHAHIIYMDMDTKDVRKLKAKGMNAVCLSSSDTVGSVMRYLGDHDGVMDWLPHGDNDTKFLSSTTDDGASQLRVKSRLCMAKYLNDNASELNSLLDEIRKVGKNLVNETLRVMIVSSVAGGTGAGTFIQVALYLRNYFRQNGHKDISIMGLFACPDLFLRASNADGRTIRNTKENMYSNAYAAVRELNAMNLAVNLSTTARKKEGYGKNINIKIDTRSEGKLFDSNDPELSKNDNNKPFNILYFVDANNAEGGVLRSLDQYYDVMADIVHTRLYSPIEGPLRSDESNELTIHARYPSAIYGSAGYSRIIYPYHGILNYLAVRKTYDELDYTWSILDREWEKYKRTQQMIAAAKGSVWTETTEERGKRYVSDMNVLMGKANSKLRGFKGMIRNGNAIEDRAEEFLSRLDTVIQSGNGINKDSESNDEIFGLHNDDRVSKLRDKLSAAYANLRKAQDKSVSAEAALSKLKTQAKLVEVLTKEYGAALEEAVLGRAVLVASQVVPKSELDAKQAEEEKNTLNLFYGLLSIDGVAVHPLAARYLLYRLREKMLEVIDKDSDNNVKDKSMSGHYADLRLAFDEDRTDGRDVTVDMRVQELAKTFVLFRGADTKKAIDNYCNKLASVANGMMNTATNQLQDEVYRQVLEIINKLIKQYEGLFDNLKQYRENIAVQLEQEAERHESASDDRCIYVNASRDAKEYLYAGDLRTRDVLERGSSEISAASGRGIYDALMARTWKMLEREEAAIITGYQDAEKDTFSDMGSVFTNVMKIYRDYLEENATHLDGSAINALVEDICHGLGISVTDLADHTNRVRVQSAFHDIIADMMEKARPMLNFDFENKDTYYDDEATNPKISTTVYKHFGLCPAQKRDLQLIYGGTDAEAALEEFEREFRPSRQATVSTEMSQYELICFQAVHCLQPTQIRKFHESNNEGYYPYYVDRLRGMTEAGQYSETPHLDKRWHLREAMPYISRSMEQKWIAMTAKAFVNELLGHKFRYTTDSDGMTCFTYKKGGKVDEAHVYWPQDKLVTINDISRLLEYLQEHDARVETLCDELDTIVENVADFVSKYTDNMSNYKRALTLNEVMTELRSNVLVRRAVVDTVTAAHGKNASSKAKTAAVSDEDLAAAAKLLGTDALDSVDTANSLGGILNVAWLVHKSEERQGRDYDFGEAMLRCVLEIVEKLCSNMFGEDVAKESDEYANYRDLYNSILEKFMESFVVGMLAQLKQLNPELLKDAKLVRYYRYLNVPEVITNTQEFAWLSKCWQLKK